MSKNPFSVDICRGPDRPEPTVPHLNGHVVDAIEAWVRQVDADENLTKFLPVVSSNPGWGKTHCLSQAVARLAGNHFVVPIAVSQNDVSQYVLRKMIHYLRKHPVKGHSIWGFEKIALQFLKDQGRLDGLENWQEDSIDCPIFQDWLRGSEEGIAGYLFEAMEKAQVFGEEGDEMEYQEWAIALTKLLSDKPSVEREALQWIRGESRSLLEATNDALIENDDRVAAYELRINRIIQLVFLASHHRSLVLLFDQIENALISREIGGALVSLIERTVTLCPRASVVVTINGATLNSFLEDTKLNSMLDRMVRPPALLEPLNPTSASELVRLRFQHNKVEEMQGFKRIPPDWINGHFKDDRTIGARDFIRRCAKKWDDPVIEDPDPTSIDWKHEYKVRRRNHHAAGVTFDEDALETFMHEICGATPLESTKYALFENDAYCIGFEESHHWKRWEGLAKAIRKIGKPAILFRPSESLAKLDNADWRKVPGENWSKTRECLVLIGEKELEIREIDRDLMERICAASTLVLDAIELKADRSEAISQAAELLREDIGEKLMPKGFIAMASVARLQQLSRSTTRTLPLSETLSPQAAGSLFHEFANRICQHVRTGRPVRSALEDFLNNDPLWLDTREHFAGGRGPITKVLGVFAEQLESRMADTGFTEPGDFFLGIEQSVTDIILSKGGMKVVANGRIDLIEASKNGNPVIVDHKLCRSFEESWHLTQLALYAMILRREPYNLQCDARFDIYLGNGGFSSIRYTHQDLISFFEENLKPSFLELPPSRKELSQPAQPARVKWQRHSTLPNRLSVDVLESGDVFPEQNEATPPEIPSKKPDGKEAPAGSQEAKDSQPSKKEKKNGGKTTADAHLKKVYAAHPHIADAFQGFIGNQGAVFSIVNQLIGSHPDSPNPSFLLTGPGGLGKTTLAKCIAEALDLPLLESSGNSLTSPDVLLERLRAVTEEEGLEVKEIGTTGGKIRTEFPPILVFIDEAHLMKKKTTEGLLKATEPKDRILEGSSEVADVRQLWYVIASTDASKLPPPFLTRFFKVNLVPYTQDEVVCMLKALSEGKGVPSDVLRRIARLANCNPRQAGIILQAVGAFSRTIDPNGKITAESLDEYMDMQSLDDDGLGPDHYTYLRFVAEAPRSMATLVTKFALNEEEIVTSLEGPLTKLDLIEKSASGRRISEKGRRRLETV